MKGKKTIVIAAHRLSTIKEADRIVIIDKGKILNTGTFKELMRNDKNFKRMIEFQEI